ncbi:hypothetical protein AB0442_20600 [Kitasatospora sp. NPDC085895]|uniref:hypothetical protein n=1 Tax=Kitasatospora sp. NPDC085895 TaxID=3155057 RepID=UPI00344D8A52
MSFRRTDPAVLHTRYALAPQMRAYDALEPHVHPYVGLSAPRGARGTVVSTDAEGFRRTPWRGGWTDTASAPSALAGILLGGSFSFGVGASGDGTTIAAHLARSRSEPWLNLGIRAGNSGQELSSVLPFAAQAPVVVLCSGVNNLVAELQSTGPDQVYGPLFFEEAVAAVGSVPVHDLVEQLNGERPGGGAALDRLRSAFGRGAQARRPSPAAPAPHGPTLADRRDRALARQVRDLSLLVRMTGPEKVLFCLQPFAEARSRTAVPQEQQLLGVHDRRQGPRWERVRDFALASWPWFAASMEAACLGLGVRFLDLEAASFEGWSFVDRVHLTDDGYEQAARRITEEL